MAGLRTVALRGGVGRAILVLTLVSIAGCLDGRTRLVVRTDVPESVRDRIETAFEEAHPGVDVRFSVEDESTTAAELRTGEDPDFDVWWGGRAELLEEAVRSAALAEWHPWASSPFVVAFDRQRVALVDAPLDWIDVLHHGWADDVLVPDPVRSGAGAAFVLGAVAEAIRRDGDGYIGFEWLERVDGQVLRYVSGPDEALRGVRMGTASLAIVPLEAFERAREPDGTLYERTPGSRDAAVVMGVGARAAEGPRAAAAASFVSFVTSEEGRAEEMLPPGFELPADFERADAELVADSASTWLARWRESVRGRGK
jgi:ABC-type Fe3+ transport system substrate-binding protein